MEDRAAGRLHAGRQVQGVCAAGLSDEAARKVFGEYGLLGRYAAHPDSSQERFFFGLLRECLDKGIIEEGLLREEMKRNHVRHDALKVIERTPPLASREHAAVS